MADSDSKSCRTCGLTLPLSSFHRAPSNKDGLTSDCRSCHAKACSERYHRNKILRPLSPTQICAHCGKEFPRPQPKRPGDPPRVSTKHCSLECRFWSKVDKSGGPDSCWNWIAKARAQGGRGYGNFMFNGKARHAHRVAWELTNGPIPAGLYGCHKCDNPLCCNPSHLFLGTAKDNSDDMRAKGRGWSMADHPELIERLRQMKIGKKRSPETIEKMRAAARGRPSPFKGKPRPDIAEAKRQWWANRKAQESDRMQK